MSPNLPQAGPSTASSFSFQTADLIEILEDLSTRFILNLPPSELSSIPRICFQVEQAFWFYEDFNRELNPSLPSYTLKRFSEIFFKVCPLLSEWSDEHEQMFLEFMRYKMRVPVCGAILINESWDKCLLVKGWKGNTWSFPKGKINQEEPKHICAAREVLEETGYDCTHLLNQNHFLETTIQGQRVTLFIVPGVSEEYQFKTLTRKEIGAIQWFKLKDLPGWKRKGVPTGSQLSSKVGSFKFYMILPFVQLVQQFIKHHKPRGLSKNGDTISSLPSPSPTPEYAQPSSLVESPVTPKQATVSLELLEPIVPEAEIPGTSSKSDSISALDDLFKRFLNSQEPSPVGGDGERTRGTNTPVPRYMAEPGFDGRVMDGDAGRSKESSSSLDDLFGNITLHHTSSTPVSGIETPSSLSSSLSSSPTSSSTGVGVASSAAMYHVQPQPSMPHWNINQRLPNPSLLALLNPAHPSPPPAQKQPQLYAYGPDLHQSTSFGSSPLFPPSSHSPSSSSISSIAEPFSASSPLVLGAGIKNTAATQNLSKEKRSLLESFLSPPSVHKLPHHQQQQQPLYFHQHQAPRGQAQQDALFDMLDRSLPPSVPSVSPSMETFQPLLASQHQPYLNRSSVGAFSDSTRGLNGVGERAGNDLTTFTSFPSSSSHQSTLVQHHSPVVNHHQVQYQPYPPPPVHHTASVFASSPNHPLHQNPSPSLAFNGAYASHQPHLRDLAAPTFPQSPNYPSSASVALNQSQGLRDLDQDPSRLQAYPNLPHLSSPGRNHAPYQPENLHHPHPSTSNSHSNESHRSSMLADLNGRGRASTENDFKVQLPARYSPSQPSHSHGYPAQPFPPSSTPAHPHPQVHKPVPVPHPQTSQQDLDRINAHALQHRELIEKHHLKNKAAGGGGSASSLLSILNRGTAVGLGKPAPGW